MGAEATAAILTAMTRTFSIHEARRLLPEVRRRSETVIRVRAELAELRSTAGHGGLADYKAAEAALHEQLGWFVSTGLEVKGVAPLLLDFPAVLDEVQVLLCWLEGEEELSWYHRAEHGFLGRRRLPGA